MSSVVKGNRNLRLVSVVIAMILLLCGYGSSTWANETDINWSAFNIKLVTQQIIPGYKAMSAATDSLEQSSKQLCLLKDDASLLAVKVAFHQSMDAWQSIQYVNFGPIEYAMRSASLQFWPDKKNHIGKQLNQLVSSKDTARLAQKFDGMSVSIKGLPAIERLLYTADSLTELSQDPYRCQVLQRISQNASEISHALSSEWQNFMLAQFEDASGIDGFFEDEIDAATALLKTIVEPIEIVRDLKLKRPLGSQFGKQKFKRLESWRSQRSLRNIRLNIKVIENSLPLLNSVLTYGDANRIAKQLAKVTTLIDQIPSPLEQSIQTESAYEVLIQLVTQLNLLHKNLEQGVSKVGIHLGFNSRDGD